MNKLLIIIIIINSNLNLIQILSVEQEALKFEFE